MEMIAACGIICSNCSAFKATQANDPAAIQEVASEWSKIFKSDIKPEHILCDGCLSNSERKCANCAGCSVRTCVTSRGISNCAECDDYGCETIANFLNACAEPKDKLAEMRGAYENS